MKRWKLAGIVVFIGVTMCVVTHAQKEVRKQKKKKPPIPDVVKKAIDEHYIAATITSAELEQADVEVYEVRITKNGDKILVTVSQDGTVVTAKSRTAMTDVPSAAAAAITKAAEGGKINRITGKTIYAVFKVEKLDKPRTVYEARLSKGRERKGIRVASDGTVVEQTKWRKPGVRPTRPKKTIRPTKRRTGKTTEEKTPDTKVKTR